MSDQTNFGNVIDVRSACTPADVDSAATLFDAVLGHHRGWNSTRDDRRAQWHADPGLVVIALKASHVVGAAGCSAHGIHALGVAESARGRGLARRLLARSEVMLRARGVRFVGLGSVDTAVGFYMKCGYRPQLLVQFEPQNDNPESIIEALLHGILSTRNVVRREHEGRPQLWLQDGTIDWDLKARIEAEGPGVVAGYVMTKPL